MLKNKTNYTSIQSIRFIGLLYVLVIICAGFSQGYVRETLINSNNPVASAQNILAHKKLFQFGFTTDLIAFILDAVISVMFYQLFKPFAKTLAMVSSAFRLLAHPAIASINLLNHYMALKVLEMDSISNSFSTNQIQEISGIFMTAHHYGYLIAGGFFGVHCLLLAVLIYKTNIFPKVFAGLLLGAAAGYLIETFVNFNIPGYEGYTALIVGIAAAIGEVALSFYMLLKGATTSYQKLKLQ